MRLTQVAKLVFGITILFTTPCLASGGTREEAKAMAIKAVELIKSEGREKAYATFMQKDGAFHDRDLYVVIMGTPDGKFKVHGANPVLVGKGGADMKDASGKEFTKEMLAVTDAAWVDYRWADPTDKTVKDKSSYVIREGDSVVMVGYYR